MDLDWKPIVHSPTLVRIPVVSITYDPGAFARWKSAREPWRASAFSDHSVFGEYAALARAGRLRLPQAGHSSYHFGEVHTAFALERAGFTCWTDVQLFKYGKKHRQETLRGRNTSTVTALWDGRPWPGDLKKLLEQPDDRTVVKHYRPRNPDIVAYSKSRDEWRFCEVKRAGDHRYDPEQLTALAVLHLLTGAPVAVVRAVPVGTKTKAPEFMDAQVRYKVGANLDWIQTPAI